MLCLWFYFSDRIKEYFLPEGDTWNQELLLSQNDTGYRQDLRFPAASLLKSCVLNLPCIGRDDSTAKGSRAD